MINEGTPGDSTAAFVSDLRDLHRRRGEPTFAAMARRTGVSKTSLNDAMTKLDRLPSSRVVEALVGMLEPAAVAAWLERRVALLPQPAPPEDAAAASVGGGTSPSIPPLRDGVRRQRARRAAVMGAVVMGAVVGSMATVVLLTPHELGGVDIATYCAAANPRAVDVRHESTWNGWVCVLKDGATVPVDVDAACRYQYPGWGPFNGARYAIHGTGWSSWRCVGALVNP